MTVKDYALELGIETSQVLSTLKSLGYKYNNENDMLDDEAIIVLDNELGDLSKNNEDNLSEELNGFEDILSSDTCYVHTMIKDRGENTWLCEFKIKIRY